MTQLQTTLTALELQADEQAHRLRMLELLASGADCFERTCYPAHFTGSALIVSADGQHALLHHHRKLDRWMQFGGHCDGDEDVLRVARREALEESGIPGLIVASARPFDLDIHEIPARASEPAHFHYDIRFVLIAPADSQFVISPESVELRWFTPRECAQLNLGAGLDRLIGKWQKLLARRASH